MKKSILGLILLTFAALTAPNLANATFMIDPDPSGLKLYLESASDTSLSYGNVGSQTGPLIDITTNVPVNVDGSGFGTIQDVHGLLSSLLFTPDVTNTDKYGDFSFRGQLNSAGNVYIDVTDQNGVLQEFNITEIAHQDFASFGIISTDGEWLSSVRIWTDQTFNEVKQVEFSFQENPVPEPGTMLLLGIGFTGLVIYSKRRKNAA